MLDGIRIIEIEGLGPGPFAAMLLADLGADVIVVHRKGGTGRVTATEAPVLDRGKRSIELDLKDPEDKATLLALVRGADALIEGFRPGVMERLGLGPDICLAENPRLVFGRMTGWGQDSALSHAAGHDFNYLSMSGAAWYSGLDGDAPFPPPTLVGDIGGGSLYLVVGLLSGLLNARATGHGTVVDAAIYDGSAHMMNLLMTLRQRGGLPRDRAGSALGGPYWSRCYRTSDGGYMSVQCLEPQFYATFVDLLGLADDPDFRTQQGPDRWPELAARLDAIFASKTRDDWASLFLGTDACVAPVLDPVEAMQHPMNHSRATWREIDGALQAAPAPRFSTRPDWTPRPSPKRGADTDAILAELKRG